MKQNPLSGKMISIVAPVYNEEANIAVFVERVVEVTKKNYEAYELILINDGSKDSSLEKMLAIAADNKNVKIVNFARNFGHQSAISAGWDFAQGDAVITLDSDLQDQPELIPELVNKWTQGFQVVNAVRKTRKDGWLKRTTAKVFYKFLNSILTSKIPENVGDYRLLDKRVVDVLRQITERDRYIRGLTNWVGFRQAFVEFDRDKRIAGKTNYSIGKMFNLALNGIFSFSDFPRKLAHLAWLFSVFITMVLLVYATVLHYMGINTPGWTSQVFIMLCFSSIQLFLLAIVLEYVSRTYREVQARPLYVVADKVNFDKK
ncbi:glycosyltransferase family 2 protein [Candidatus Dojkabacteria bacterium]|uniref:Glycosyltransferase 2-like domain-containing protein n=2 Tax=Candidatus Dojkabacteria TaxID=74243 RepID=A0A136KFS5_9BACT|nr:MAG: hypothetical protein UZ20_WS6002000795 [candidate division WS6 bacterium OLB21]MBW7953348.1 glycosyltransferase family 2 protein [Candidatus Dojkabacteria bacterium]